MYSIKKKIAAFTKQNTINEENVASSSGSSLFSKKTKPGKMSRSKTTPEFGSTISFATSNTSEESFGLPEVNLNGYKPETRHRVVKQDMCNDLRSLMPTRIQLYANWTLLYSLEQHGASLSTLYSDVKPSDRTNKRVGYLMAIEDMDGGVFGVYTNEYFHPTEKRRYYGNGECFLWKIEHHGSCEQEHDKEQNQEQQQEQQQQQPDRLHKDGYIFQGFPYTGLNEFNIYGTAEFLSFGAGSGHYGLWVDHDLLNGVSDRCLTYGNDELSKQGAKFQIKALEVWRIG